MRAIFLSARDRLRAEFASRLARDTLVVFFFSGFGRAVALGKEMLVAAFFGVGGLLDAYVLAFLIPSLLVNMFGASFASALIPALGGASEKNGAGQAGGRLLGRALLAQAALVALTALVLALLPVQALRLLAPLLTPERLALVKAMQTTLLPLFLLGSLSQTLAASVNYRGNFRGPALASTLNALATILVIALLHSTLGIQALVAGVDAGAALEFCILAWLLRRAWGGLFHRPTEPPNQTRQTHQTRPDRPGGPVARGQRGFLRALLRDWFMLALGASTLAVAAFVDNLIASTLGEGSVSALSYAWKLPSGFATLLGLTLSTVLLPYFTGIVHHAPAGQLALASRRIVKRLLLVCTPLAVAGALASPLLVALLFQRGRFDAQAASLVSVVQACYFTQLPFYLLCIVTQRMLQALSQFRFLLLLQTGLVLLNALTSYIFSRAVGIAGIALSSTLMFALTAGISLWAIRRQLHVRAQRTAA
ncbi:MAG: lipid II flippase MurJ [Humidesulfovibrio sp.]|nr:lipid II flippase MurJ [Humidesulfovibrio sp.]